MPKPISRSQIALMAGLGLAVAGCSGETLVVAPVEFDGSVTSADYIGETFPVAFLVGEEGDPTGSTSAGQGSITYNSASSITLRLPNGRTASLTRTGTSGLGTNFRGTLNGETIDVTVSDFASTEAFRLISSADDEISILGGFGFETAVGDRPASATYSTAGAIFITAENVGPFLPAAGSGDLSANFTGGTITGTLLDADPVSVAVAGAELVPDDLTLVFELENGVITPSGFRGDVGVTGELVVDGAGAPVVLGTNVTGDQASGQFYGDAAEVVSGTFGTQVGLSDSGGALVDLDVDGFFSGGAD
ncbi:MAG: hypothetical protein AAGO57_04840 [Pseudomonadota bacterium]